MSEQERKEVLKRATKKINDKYAEAFKALAKK